MGRLILVEGMDLAGKSTVVEGLGRHLQRAGWQVRLCRNALCPDNPLARAAAEGLGEGSQRGAGAGGIPERTALEGACAFIAAHLWDARHFQPPGPGMLHLQDSCWLRTLAWEDVLGSSDPVGTMVDTRRPSQGGALAAMLRAASVDFPVFEQAIFLTADLPTRHRRYARRTNNNSQDGLSFEQPERFLTVEQRLRELTCELVPTVEIDTSDLGPQEVLERCLRQILSAQLDGSEASRATIFGKALTDRDICR